VFRSPRANLIESDEEFSVEVLGRTGIMYREADHAMFVDAEVSAHSGIALWKERIKHWRIPNQDELIDDAKRIQIIDNIRRAIESRGDHVEVIG
jgi:hypothetical protein